MSECPAYKQALPPGATLRVFNGETPVFSASGKWLMPLFELEHFLESYTGKADNLAAHDTAVGKAGVVLMDRLGIRRVHAEMASDLAVNYVAELNAQPGRAPLEFSYENKVPRLLCATESQLEPLVDQNEMYRILRRRASLVDGLSVSVSDLSSPYGSIQGLSFSLPAGGTLMVVGENGSGKTTLLRHLIGALKPAAGTVLINGKPPQALEPGTICYVPQQQDNKLFSLSVEEVVSLGVRARGRESSERVGAALERVECARLRGRGFSTLSGGERQKVSLARCLAQGAKVLLLDEPTAALDEASREMVAEALSSLALREIPTIIGVSHDEAFTQRLGWERLRLVTAV
jgi:ABC-type Mn2+/Zn2+ transport system ATPase subunit